MAEGRGTLIAKSMQKHAGRAKEKILQNLGKVDRTSDDIFEEHLQNFMRQQGQANRLQKEFSNYIRCVRALQGASKSLMDAIGDVYEGQWPGQDMFFGQAQAIDMLFADYSHKLADQVLIPLNTYQGQFAEMKKKVDKRGRKLVDYDGQRHSFQALQMSMTKKRDDAKLSKGRETLEEAKRTYEVLNSELHDELPALFDSRVLFLVTNLQTLFNSEQIFHAETAKVFNELEVIVDNLATESQRGSYTIKKTNGASLPRKITNDFVMNNVSTSKSNTLTRATTENLPAGVLYRVKATYKYAREDVDELSFDVGEIVSVIEYDDPEEQEEGWLMGVKDNGEKGMFPANFTKPI